MECAISRLSSPTHFTACVISSSVDMSVLSIRGRPVARTRSSRGRSVREAEAILYSTGLNCSMKSTEGSSQHEVNQSTPSAWQ